MKLKNFFILLSLFFVLSCCIATISAADNALNNTISESDFISENNDNTAIGVDDSASVQNSNTETLKESVDFTGTNFTSLQDKINSVSEGDTIELKDNIIQDGTSEITISKSVTINGNGHTIDANKKSRIFNIANGNVILNNLTFTNGNSDYGGAIYATDNGGKITINNCSSHKTPQQKAGQYTIMPIQ